MRLVVHLSERVRRAGGHHPSSHGEPDGDVGARAAGCSGHVAVALEDGGRPVRDALVVDDVHDRVGGAGVHLAGAVRDASEAVGLDGEAEALARHGAVDLDPIGAKAVREVDRLRAAGRALAGVGPAGVHRERRGVVGDARVDRGRGDRGVGLSRRVVGGGATVDRRVDRRAGIGRGVGTIPDHVRSVPASGREGHRGDEPLDALHHGRDSPGAGAACGRFDEVRSCRSAEGTGGIRVN